jgi:hypothetical protein
MQEIIINPIEKQLDNNLKKAREVIILHNLKNEGHLREWELNYENMGYEIVYIHYYSSDKTYTMGLKNEELFLCL